MRNVPGICRVVPYTNSAVVRCMSSLSAVWIPNITKGRVSMNLSVFSRQPLAGGENVQPYRWLVGGMRWFEHVLTQGAT